MLKHSIDMTSSELDLYARVVGCLRSGGSGEEISQQTIGDITALLRSDFGASYFWDRSVDRYKRCAAINIDERLLRHYDERMHVRDTVTPALKARAQATRVDDVISRQNLERSELYTDFLKPCGMHHGANIFFFVGERNVGDLRIWRNARQSAFGTRELLILNALAPHYQMALSPGQNSASALTPRERTVMELVAAGHSDKEIARLMSISFTTVRTHLGNAMAKTASKNRTMLATHWKGMVSPQ